MISRSPAEIEAALKSQGTSIAEFDAHAQHIAETALLLARTNANLATAILFESLALTFSLLIQHGPNDMSPAQRVDEMAMAFAERMAQILNGAARRGNAN